jgi:hypothetical protein
MSIMDDFTPDHDYSTAITKGEHDVKIIELEERTSQAGNRMIAIKLETGSGDRLFYNIVKNEWFNKNMTRFMDCFGIPTNVLNPQLWLHRRGRVYVDKGREREDGKCFMEIKYLIVPAKPQNQTLASVPRNPKPEPSDDGFTDDIPF